MIRMHALYRFFNSTDQLLYVGITANIGERWNAHAANKPWWWEVVRVTVQHFPSRTLAHAAETAAIVAEKPKYNITHNRRRLVTISSGYPGRSAGTVHKVRGTSGFARSIPVYRVDLGGVARGREYRGRRLGLVMNSTAHDLRVATVIPLARDAKSAAFRPMLILQGKRFHAIVDQVRSVDLAHVYSRPVAYCFGEESAEVEHALTRYLGLMI